jgi:4-diphosphocytidyl-2-C-methyl-D-erythritol kinase
MRRSGGGDAPLRGQRWYTLPMLRLLTRAPAKINLVLRVGPRRPDGYHDIESLMVPLDLADRIEVRLFPGKPGPVTCRCPGHPDLEGSANLGARAAEAFRRRFGVSDRCHLLVQKRIPVTAGLGGGSSDAAAALRCLARAYRVRDRRALAEVALEVGSDVPFFLWGGPAWARGRGERLSAAKVPPIHALLVHPRHPRLAIRAADAYRWLDEARQETTAARPARRGRPFRTMDMENDLQVPCLSRYSDLEAIRRHLEGNGAAKAIMSGSGPTVVGVFAARRAGGGELPGVGMLRVGGEAVDVFLTRSLRRQPGVSSWKSPRSASFPSTKRSSRPT